MNIVLPLVHLDNLVFSPLPQFYLKAYAVESGIKPEEIQILEFSREDDLANTVSEIIKSSPQILAFSTYVWNFKFIKELSRSIKQLLGEKVLIVWGGPHISEKPEEFIKNNRDSVDIIVGWYGEKSFTEIIKKYRENYSIEEITRSISGTYSAYYSSEAKKSDFIPIEKLPSPHNIEWFPEDLKLNIDKRVFLVETYRNCPFSCGYCLWGQADNKIDCLSEDQVIESFEYLISLGARHFKFADAGLGFRRSRDKKILKWFVDNKIWEKGVHLRTYFFWQCLDEEWCEIFKILIEKKVLGQLDIGIQTFNRRAIEVMQRPTNFKRFDQAIEMLNRFEIPFSIDLILGLPGDSLEGWRSSVRKTLSYGPQRFQSFLCSVLPGTYYDLNREKLGLKTVKGSSLDDDEKVLECHGFSFHEVQEALNIESWLYFCFSINICSHLIHTMSEDLVIDKLDMVESLMTWAESNGPQLCKTISGYRNNLYDSRQKGRVEIETAIIDNFIEINQELHQFIDYKSRELQYHDILDIQFFSFPKTKALINSLKKLENITFVDEGSMELTLRSKKRVSFNNPKDFPILGVIGTKYQFWVWEPREI